MEAAGQTGLERATGDLVFIQESNTAVRIEDLQRLLQMSDDNSIVAAQSRKHSATVVGSPGATFASLAREANQRINVSSGPKSSLQMIRRPHLQKLTGPAGKDYQLHGETYLSTTVQ